MKTFNAENFSMLLWFLGSQFFSHYNHGDNGHKGECGCFSTCSWPGRFDCEKQCDDDDLNRDSNDCHCMRYRVSKIGQKIKWFWNDVYFRGPMYPNVDDCELFPK